MCRYFPQSRDQNQARSGLCALLDEVETLQRCYSDRNIACWTRPLRIVASSSKRGID